MAESQLPARLLSIGIPVLIPDVGSVGKSDALGVYRLTL